MDEREWKWKRCFSDHVLAKGKHNLLLLLFISMTLVLLVTSYASGNPLQAQAVSFSDRGAVNNQYDLRRSLFVDVDGDGDEDLIGYSTWNPRQLRLLINRGDGTFSEETQARGLYLSYSNIHHTTAFDVDNDGDFDLWVGDGENESSSNRLFINDGKGYFSNSGVNFSNGSKGSGAVDVDGDGDVDLVDMGNDEQTGGTLYINNGGTLSPTTNRFDGGRPHGYQGPIFGDYDDDGDPDMFTTANYYGQNHLYRNEGNGTFTDVTDQYGLSFQSECYGADGAAWADFDNDGDLDLLVLEGEGSNGNLRIRVYIRENVNHGQQFVQRFSFDRTWNGVNPEYSPDAAMVADFDNDGDLDFWPVGQRDIYYNLLNEGSAFSFSPLSSVPIPADKPSRNASWSDADNDGDIDLFYAQYNGASGEGEDVLHWYRNDLNPGANWFQVTLKGEHGDAGGYGVRVYVYEAGHAGEVAYLKGMREANSGVMYHASVSRLLHFGGLDPAKSYDLVVRKPFNRGEFVSSNVTPGKRISIDVANPGPTTTFVDVPATHWAYEYIEYLYKNGFISGCSTQPSKYCPENGLTRAEMAVFVERGARGGGYMPPTATEIKFIDVPLDQWFAKWVKILSDDEYTSGCIANPPQYCPLWAHTREEATVFFDRIYYGKDYAPDVPSMPFYDDVPVGLQATWSSKWIWGAYQAQLIQDCEDDANRADHRFRPKDELTRAEAACILYHVKINPPPLP